MVVSKNVIHTVHFTKSYNFCRQSGSRTKIIILSYGQIESFHSFVEFRHHVDQRDVEEHAAGEAEDVAGGALQLAQ